MSHPFWPQPKYLYRPGGRQSQAPVPASFGGIGDFGGGRYEVEGTPAPQGPRRGLRTYGSMSPKYDWATPGYIRSEPGGLGYFGEEEGSSDDGEYEIPDFDAAPASGTDAFDTWFDQSGDTLDSTLTQVGSKLEAGVREQVGNLENQAKDYAAQAETALRQGATAAAAALQEKAKSQNPPISCNKQQNL